MRPVSGNSSECCPAAKHGQIANPTGDIHRLVIKNDRVHEKRRFLGIRLGGIKGRTGDRGVEPSLCGFHSHWGRECDGFATQVASTPCAQTRLHSHCSGMVLALPMLQPICIQSSNRRGRVRLGRRRRSGHDWPGQRVGRFPGNRSAAAIPCWLPNCRRCAPPLWRHDGGATHFRAWTHALVVGQPLERSRLWLAEDLPEPFELEVTYEENGCILHMP